MAKRCDVRVPVGSAGLSRPPIADARRRGTDAGIAMDAKLISRRHPNPVDRSREYAAAELCVTRITSHFGGSPGVQPLKNDAMTGSPGFKNVERDTVTRCFGETGLTQTLQFIMGGKEGEPIRRIRDARRVGSEAATWNDDWTG